MDLNGVCVALCIFPVSFFLHGKNGGQNREDGQMKLKVCVCVCDCMHVCVQTCRYTLRMLL